MKRRDLIGIGGILVAVTSTELNDQVTNIVLTDISGGLGIGQDPASWLHSLYITGELMGMCVAPSLGISFSLRRFALFAVGLSCATSLLIPWGSSLPILFGLRFLQGLAEGFTIPLLMTVALRLLDPPVRLYGLALYALTATFIPNLATTVAALWVDVIGDWHFVFLQALPLSAVAAVLIWYGMAQEPPQYERLKKFDWSGALIVLLGFGSLSTALQQGDRYDWYDSPEITAATILGIASIPLFIINELRVPVPLVRLDLLKRRNFAYATICLFTFLIATLSASTVPINFLEQIHAYRPLQAQTPTLEIALLQLIMLPAAAALLDRPWVDSRIVSAVGFMCILTSCVGCAFLNISWTRQQFEGWQLLQAIGQPLVVMPLLMMATNTLKPDEGPFASALVNTTRAVAEAFGGWLIALIVRTRGSLHRNRILDLIGDERVALAQTGRVPDRLFAPIPGGPLSGGGEIATLNAAVQQQVLVLTTIDSFLLLGALVVFLLIVLATLPVRTYPPRIALAAKH